MEMELLMFSILSTSSSFGQLFSLLVV